jgi:hypothetical protein
MTISEVMMTNKISKGQFFTKKDMWLKKHILDFIISTKRRVIYDPFAGGGDLIKVFFELGYKKSKGFDLDPELGWELNDSLKNIPKIENSILITNPPYISKSSAIRKKLSELDQYFFNKDYDDVYLLALEKMLESNDFVVAIVPETFINSNFKHKNLLHSITVIEDNPFDDTENPICVLCFDSVSKDNKDIRIYKNEKLICDLETLNSLRIFPEKKLKVKFNDSAGWLGIRGIDSTDPNVRIKFDFKENIDYDWINNIKISSRHFTLVNFELSINLRARFIDESNILLKDLRERTSDLILTPFKGNTKKGVRRRRLDFLTARAIIEAAFNITIGNTDKGKLL